MLFSLLPKHPCLTLVTLYSMMQSSRSFVTLNLDGNGQLYLLNTNGLIIKTTLTFDNVRCEFIDKTKKNLGCQWSFSSDIFQGKNFIIQELENNVEWKSKRKFYFSYFA